MRQGLRARLLCPPAPSGAPSTPPLRLAAGGAGPLVDAPKRGAGVWRLLCRGLAVLHGVRGYRARPGDPRQVHHVRGDAALGEGHAYLREAAELGRDPSRWCWGTGGWGGGWAGLPGAGWELGA